MTLHITKCYVTEFEVHEFGSILQFSTLLQCVYYFNFRYRRHLL
jgi:hypothetical protein